MTEWITHSMSLRLSEKLLKTNKYFSKTKKSLEATGKSLVPTKNNRLK